MDDETQRSQEPGEGRGPVARAPARTAWVLHAFFWILYGLLLLQVAVGIPEGWADSAFGRLLGAVAWPILAPLRWLLPGRMEAVLEHTLPGILGLLVLVFLHVILTGLLPIGSAGDRRE